MKLTRADLVSLLLIAVMCGVAAWLYPLLPDPVPTHWNAAGQADGYTPKPWGAMVFPLTLLGTWLLFRIIPVISPRGYRMDRFPRIVEIFKLTLLAVLFLIGIVALLAAAGWNVRMQWVVPLSVAVLFIVLGNYMGKVRRNFFIGVRTPWTLASEEVWNRTHRLAGWLFVLAGLVVVAATLGGWPLWLEIATFLAAALVPVFYSLWLYHRLEGFPHDG